jgi:hypothetical protein
VQPSNFNQLAENLALPSIEKIVPSYSGNMEVTHQPYQAVPLDLKTSTRLLTVHHGSGEGAIKCSLAIVDLETKPRYKALSYCWGSPDNAKQLLLDEHFVDVRENLWSALWHLRFPHDDRILWVDALCINQSDFLERNHQVGLMSTIYSKAGWSSFG